MVSLFGFGARGASVAAPQAAKDMPDIVRDFRADADAVSQRIATAFLLYIDEGVRAHGGKIVPVSFDRRAGTLYVEMTGTCDGCALAQKTLQDGIMVVMKAHVPQVKAVKACIPT